MLVGVSLQDLAEGWRATREQSGAAAVGANMEPAAALPTPLASSYSSLPANKTKHSFSVTND